MSELRKSFKKGWNFIKESLVNVNKGATFAPATTTGVHWNTDKLNELGETKVLKNNSKKACEIWKRMLHLHPAKHGKFIDRLVNKKKKKESKIF